MSAISNGDPVALHPTTTMIAERITMAVYGSAPGPIPRGVQVAPKG